MMTNFFNAIGVADMERVHSAVIGWMLSEGCIVFDPKTKSDIINTMFGLQPSRVFCQISVSAEVFDIDILITTEDQNGKQECWVIENKIKSNQHSNQLDKYVKIIAGEKIKEGKKEKIITEKYKYIPEANRHFCFLTLIGEAPQGGFSQKWKNFTYNNLSRIFERALKNGNTTHEHWIILNEYAKCIKELNEALSDFLKSPTSYEHVFTDGNKRKDEKDEQYLQNISSKSGSHGRFISECGLETIFQKCYLGEKWNAYLQKTQKNYDWGISETRGNAALDIGYPTIRDKSTGKKYNTQVEFQNGTFKIQITPPKDNNISKDEFFKKWEELFNKKKEELNQNITGKRPKWRVNCSRSNNNNRYISLSLQVEKWWAEQNLWKLINNCENLLKKLIAEGNCVTIP